MMDISNRLKTTLRWITAAGFLTTGIAHFLVAPKFVRIVPPVFPRPLLLVQISGISEIAGAIGLLIPRLRRWAAWGLILLLISVFPANVYMAIEPNRFADLKLPVWALWLRLPFQAVFIAMVWWAGIREDDAA